MKLYLKKQYDIRKFKRFGSRVLVYKENVKSKLDYRAEYKYFVGYTNSTVNFRLLNMEQTDVKIHTNVYFLKDKDEEDNESEEETSREVPLIFKQSSSDTENEEQETVKQVEIEMIEMNEISVRDIETDDSNKRDDTEIEESQEEATDDKETSLNEEESQEEATDDNEISLNEEEMQDKRNYEADIIFATTEINNIEVGREQVFDHQIKISDVKIPENINELFKNKHRDQWLDAIDCEYLNLIENDTWTYVDKPPDAKALYGQFVLDFKSTDNVFVERFRARFVVDGRCIAKTPEYSPVLSIESLRIVLSVAVNKGWYIHTIDIKNAYLNSSINNVIYMHQPVLYVLTDQPKKVCKLKKAQYGLPDSSLDWYKTLDKHLKDLGLVNSKIEQCIYYNEEIYVLVYVDDMCIMAPNEQKIEDFKIKLSEKLKFRDAGTISKFIGICSIIQFKIKYLIFIYYIKLKNCI